MTGYSFDEIANSDLEFAERLSTNISIQMALKYNDMVDSATVRAVIDKKNKGKSLFSKFEMISKMTGKSIGVLKQTAKFGADYDKEELDIADKIKIEAEKSEREFKKAKFLQKLHHLK